MHVDMHIVMSMCMLTCVHCHSNFDTDNTPYVGWSEELLLDSHQSEHSPDSARQYAPQQTRPGGCHWSKVRLYHSTHYHVCVYGTFNYVFREFVSVVNASMSYTHVQILSVHWVPDLPTCHSRDAWYFQRKCSTLLVCFFWLCRFRIIAA